MRRTGPEWRIGRGWSPEELWERYTPLRGQRPNFTDAELDRAHGFREHQSEALIAMESKGPPEPDGAFERGRRIVAAYRFSDPRIVTGYFDRSTPLLDRPMLLQIKILDLRYLCAVRVLAVRENWRDDESVFGFRYYTLPQHLESGAEWFLLKKRHDTGEVLFRIEAMWRPGQFPNWWSRAGFEVLGRRYQRAWHRLAHLRMRALIHAPVVVPSPEKEGLIAEGPSIPCPSIHILMPRAHRVADKEADK